MESRSLSVLKTEITKFRDDFMRYQLLCQEIWRDSRVSTKSPEASLQERKWRIDLAERLGEFQPTLQRLSNVSGLYWYPGSRIPISSLDEALSSRLFQNPDKVHALGIAIHTLNKAVGALRAMGDREFDLVQGGPARAFLAASFKSENDALRTLIRDFVAALNFDVLEGNDAQPSSVSDKVRRKIEDSSVLVAILTKDIEVEGAWLSSSWVTEECAFALARPIPVIRLIEEGADAQARIFGDQEYIPVERLNPSKALVALARMLQSVRNR